MTTHVPASVIERLAFGALARSESLRVQRHLCKCASCLRRVIEIEAGLAAKDSGRAPVPDLRKPLFVVHDTVDGLIYSRAERRGEQWVAQHWGRQLNGARECATVNEANEFLLRSLAEMFPEHRCTVRCQIERRRHSDATRRV